MAKKRKATSDAVEILHRRYYQGKADRISELDQARAEDELARRTYEVADKADCNAKTRGRKDLKGKA